MPIRFTGLNTAFFGCQWEYTNKNNIVTTDATRKLNVFISSNCKDQKYKHTRKKLKKLIEETGLANVYTFENEGAASISAGNHYKYNLEDSDVCIFLIDNKDGIGTGVQEEIDIANKHNIKSLYYFCDEKSTDKTPIEVSLKGKESAKSGIIHSFRELEENGAQWLVDEIINVYRDYCKNRLAYIQDNDKEELDRFRLSDIEKSQTTIMPKSVLDNVVLCSDYISKFTSNNKTKTPNDMYENCYNDVDEWCAKFLQILFENKTIKDFNVAMFLNVLKKYQSEKYNHVIEIRWKAIEAYFLDNIDNCLEYLRNAHKVAKETNQPTWLISDILIDLRNIELMRNPISNSQAQEELDLSEEKVYYPTLDRLQWSLHEKYIKELYKQQIESPNTVCWITNLSDYETMIASSYIVAMFNGSLTHIKLMYTEMKHYLFYLSCKYSDWKIQYNLYKFSVYTGKEKEIKNMEASYPDILNNLNSNEASEIINFCNNKPIKSERFRAVLCALGAVGYYLNDNDFNFFQNQILDEIISTITAETPGFDSGKTVFYCLKGISYRISQDKMAEICCCVMKNNYRAWYNEMFDFMSCSIDLNKMTIEKAKELIGCISVIMENKNDRDTISISPRFLCNLCKQNLELTSEIQKKIEKYFHEFYESHYKLDIPDNKETDYPRYIQKYIHIIQESNEKQGHNGTYFGHSMRYIATINNLLLSDDFYLKDEQLINDLVLTVANTLLYSKEDISTKIDAIILLNIIIYRYSDFYNFNKELFEEIYIKQEQIVNNVYLSFVSNVDRMALEIGLQFLYSSMGKDIYTDLFELLPYIQNNKATTRYVCMFIGDYLEISDSISLPDKVNDLILQNVLQWLCSEDINIRWYATNILLLLSRSNANLNLINNKVIQLIDCENAYIKNMIIQNVDRMQNINKKTKDYVLEKCKNDANYFIRMACEK